jgi:hypothetical protein
MLRDEAEGVFQRRAADPEWEMFCRGRRAVAQSWADASTAGEGTGPVCLEPLQHSSDAAAPHGARVRHFHTRIVGIVYPNDDGTSRREAVKGLRRMDRVRLVHRPDNPADANAVAVLRHPNGRQLGYLPAAVAKEVVAAARDGTRYLAVVLEVTGAGPYDFIAGGTVGATLLILSRMAQPAMTRGSTCWH